MRVVVSNLYSDQDLEFVGSAASICHQLEDRFPWLASTNHDHDGDLEALLEHLNSSQGYSADLEGGDEPLKKSEGNLQEDEASALDMVGFNPYTLPAFKAAQFLSGRQAVSHDQMRQALYDHEDRVDAALAAYGLPVDDEGRAAIKSVIGLTGMLRKSSSDAVRFSHIEPATPDAQEAAQAVTRASDNGNVTQAHLDGKHSKGSLIAKDHESNLVYLLKPGFGGPGAAAGSSQEHASQSRREVAFWCIAETLGLGEFVPRADLLIIDGKEYATITMLPFSWKGLQKRLDLDPHLAHRAFARYRDLGFIHKWAVLDWVLGNPDRHADNMMVSNDGQYFALIDHGSAFAGTSFDPAYDKKSFVPFYLRAWSGQRFNNLPVADKLARMPTVNEKMRAELKAWVNDIHGDRIAGICARFGIDPAPSIERLGLLRVAASKQPVDEAINRLWVTT